MYYINEAYNYYLVLMNIVNSKEAFFSRSGFDVEGSLSSKDWEVFGAILVDDFKSPSGHKGADLYRHEVKTAKKNRKKGTKFEYQYHRHYGLIKIEQDKTVDHIYVIYDKVYQNVEVWLLDKAEIKDVIDGFKKKVIECYHSPKKKKQRCRCTISDIYAKKHGKLLMEIEGGKLKTCLKKCAS